MNLDNILKLFHESELLKPQEEMFIITDEPKIPGYLCFPTDNLSKKYNIEEVFGQGIDPKKIKAKIKSCGECLERLCIINPIEEKFVISKFNNKEFIDPALFFCYSNEQISNREEFFDELRSSEYRWWPVINLINEEKCFIPAQLIFLSKIFNDEMPIRKEWITTGAAFGSIGTNLALINGFMESVERDSCIFSYLTKKKLSKITNLPSELEELISYLKRYNLHTNIFDATSDLGIPTVLVVTLDYTGIGSAVNVGSRASITYEEAIKYSILESIQCRRTSRVTRNFLFPEKLPTESEITSMNNRFFYWHSLERIKDLDFWLCDNGSVSYKELQKKDLTFEQALEAIKKRGYNLFVADITLPEVRNSGFETLKVVIPEFHPLYLDERAKALYSVHYGSIKDNKELKPHPLT